MSVVVLDEVGLAEDSPNLPLNALHSLLDDGTEGGDGKNIVCVMKFHVRLWVFGSLIVTLSIM